MVYLIPIKSFIRYCTLWEFFQITHGNCTQFCGKYKIICNDRPSAFFSFRHYPLKHRFFYSVFICQQCPAWPWQIKRFKYVRQKQRMNVFHFSIGCQNPPRCDSNFRVCTQPLQYFPKNFPNTVAQEVSPHSTTGILRFYCRKPVCTSLQTNLLISVIPLYNIPTLSCSNVSGGLCWRRRNRCIL